MQCTMPKHVCHNASLLSSFTEIWLKSQKLKINEIALCCAVLCLKVKKVIIQKLLDGTHHSGGDTRREDAM